MALQSWKVRKGLTGSQAPEPASSLGGFPKLVMVASLLAPIPVRATAWVSALGWMGAACILNFRRSGRTHCRYTGPYYLAMIPPVVIAGLGIVPLSLSGWIALGIVALGGGVLIWFATERAWGKFGQQRSSAARAPTDRPLTG